MSTQPWDASQGANPDTCWHMLAVSVYGPNLHVCLSCDSTLSEEYWAEFVWDHIPEHNVWKRRSIRESERTFKMLDKFDGGSAVIPFATSERFHGPDVMGYLIGDRVYNPRDVLVILRDRTDD